MVQRAPDRLGPAQLALGAHPAGHRVLVRGLGSLDLVSSISTRAINGTWWLGMVTGILEILLGFWVSQQRFPATAVLLLIWVGFFALFRGISEIVLAFELRGTQRR
jgi:uncharacterized membrane protein HdeD (DUF308 family)